MPPFTLSILSNLEQVTVLSSVSLPYDGDHMNLTLSFFPREDGYRHIRQSGKQRTGAHSSMPYYKWQYVYSQGI